MVKPKANNRNWLVAFVLAISGRIHTSTRQTAKVSSFGAGVQRAQPFGGLRAAAPSGQRVSSGNETPDNEDGFLERSEDEARQLELPKEWIA